MRKYIARKMLDQFERHYNYDVSYMRSMLEISPAAFFKFAKLTDISRHSESAPVNALYATKITGAVAEDCGPCVQLVVTMAREAGMEDDQIAAVLERDMQAMSEDTALGFSFADAIVHRTPLEDEIRSSVRAHWGDKGVIDLALALQIGRMFPMVKTALGFAKTCSSVRIDGEPVKVVKAAA